MGTFSEIIQRAETVTLIGSRKSPARINEIAVKLGRKLSDLGIVGYSGGADGMDNSFMFDYSPERRKIILPEDGFNGLKANGKDIIDFATLDMRACADEVRTIADNYDSEPPYTQRRYGRNAIQVLREDVATPTDLVIFWAPEIEFKVKGGTKIATRLARKHNIPLFNLWRDDVLNEVCDYFGIQTKPPTLNFLLDM